MLRFRRSIHTAIWGTESWEISAHPSDPSVISCGEGTGKTLRDAYPGFPLLFKVIDARESLSVQVHPNEETCRMTGGEPKAEMWCALGDGTIYAGLRPGTTAEEIETAIRSGAFENLLVRHDVKFGDALFLPGGMVHAIGAGTRLYEVQQSSNTTFRLYDWGRVGKDGKPRELHVEKGKRAIDYALAAPTLRKTLDTPFFAFSQKSIRGEEAVAARPGEFLAIFTARGDVELDGVRVAEGTSVLLPPLAGGSIRADDAHVFLTRFKMQGERAADEVL